MCWLELSECNTLRFSAGCLSDWHLACDYGTAGTGPFVVNQLEAFWGCMSAMFAVNVRITAAMMCLIHSVLQPLTFVYADLQYRMPSKGSPL